MMMYTLTNLDWLKVLAHPERRSILQYLMARPATLSQLGEHFGKTAAHIRHHVQVLEEAGLIELGEVRSVQGGPEKYYQACQPVLHLNLALLPASPDARPAITIGSIDPAIHCLVAAISDEAGTGTVLPFVWRTLPVSSLDALIALRQGLCQMATCHLIDPQTQEYNRSFIRHLFPSQPMVLIPVYQRQGGLIVAPGNPLGLRRLEDLLNPRVHLVNREAGSGVRQWLDQRLKQLGLPAEQIAGYTTLLAHSHAAVAQMVQKGQAEAGIGIAAVARAYHLDFIPLYEEPYEIACYPGLLQEPDLAPFFEALQPGNLKHILHPLSGYEIAAEAGDVKIIG